MYSLFYYKAYDHRKWIEVTCSNVIYLLFIQFRINMFHNDQLIC